MGKVNVGDVYQTLKKLGVPEDALIINTTGQKEAPPTEGRPNTVRMARRWDETYDVFSFGGDGSVEESKLGISDVEACKMTIRILKKLKKVYKK